MEEHHVRLGQQGVQVHILGNGLTGVVGVQVVGQHLHAQGLGNLASGLANTAKADHTGGLTVQLNEGVVPVAPVNMIRPLALVDGLVVVANVMAHLQQQGDGVLAHTGGAVGGHVAHHNTFLLGVVVVGHVVAGGQEGNELQVWTLIYGILGNWGLVGDNHLSSTDSFCNTGILYIGGTIIDRHIPQGLQGTPAQVAGIFGISVQNYDFHKNTPLLR